MSEKLQKVLARVGLGSRRYMEEVIAAGRDRQEIAIQILFPHNAVD
jgi:16S rRNA U516 pseudouridylate synthase RsuA-like enzyme